MSSAEHFDVTVIGAGFGGSIAACRAAEAGKSVLVLERGKRYRPGDFPRNVRDVNELFWRYPRKKSSLGLYEVRFFSGIGAVVAAGVGGGSLIYANIHIRPDASVFNDPRWPTSINRQSLEPFYSKVERMLSIAPLPKEFSLPKRNAFYQAGEKLGRAVFDPDEAVNWPSSQGASSANNGSCRFCAECEFGCQYGAKNTLDRTYLCRAEELRAQVREQSLVTAIEPQGKSFRIHFTDVTSDVSSTVSTDRVVVSAGTLGTNELLLRNREVYRTLPRVSQRLGFGYSGNGDFLGSIQSARDPFDSSFGPDVTSVMRFFEETPPFTMAAPTFSRPVMEVLASFGQRNGKSLGRFSSWLWKAMPYILPAAFKFGLLSKPLSRSSNDPNRMTNLFAIGRDNANGRIHLRNNRLDVHWNYEKENSILIANMQQAMQRVADAYGGSFAPMVLWNLCRRITTVHSLGGCAIADRPEGGVVDLNGEVFGYPGIFVADGSVVPTSIGFHPVMTISALAEMIAAHVSR